MDPDRGYDFYLYYFEEHGIEPPLESDEEDDLDYQEGEDEEEEDDGDYEYEEEEEEEETDDVVNLEVLDDDNGNGNNSDISMPSVQANVDDRAPENTDDVNVEAHGGKKGEGNNEVEFNREEIDGLFCPICFEPWASGSDHQVCCLPCGHIYGLSCIKKWLRRRSSNKCPQCKKECGVKDIRLLYATRIVAIDGELEKKVRTLEAKCTSVEKKNAEWSQKEVEWKNREADLCMQVRHFKEISRDLEDVLKNMEHRASESRASCLNCREKSSPGLNIDHLEFQMPGCSKKFKMQNKFQLDGARLFDVDHASQIFVIARRLPGFAGIHVLTKMSLLSNYDKEHIHLPLNTKAVKDLRVAPHSQLVLLATLGKKLSIISTESNNTILTYDLPSAAWSCSWDISSSHYVYAGLQNGTVMQFDMRHTTRPVESLTGLTGNLIHTVHSLAPDSSLSSSVRSVLTASKLGLCQWNFGTGGERPYLIPESENQGVCISLAYHPTAHDIVASFRPKIEESNDMEIIQPTPTQSSSFPGGQGVQGTHVLYKKSGLSYQKLASTCANVSDILLPKSSIIDGLSENPLFVYGDELTRELVFHDLTSLQIVNRFKPQKYPIRDVKYTRVANSGILGCLSDDSLQLCTTKLV